MGWPGIDYEELGELGFNCIAADLVPMPAQALARLEKQLTSLQEGADSFYARSHYAIARDMSRRVKVCQMILHNPRQISEEEVELDGPGP